MPNLQIDGEVLRYQVDGAGPGTPILAHNGLVSTTLHWDHLVAHFRDARPVVTWDYRGHGGAPCPRDLGALTVERFADDAHEVVRAAGGGPMVIAGLSFGVQVVLEHYRRHPGDARALVLICGSFGRPVDRVSARLRPLVVAAARRLAGVGPLVRRALSAAMQSRVAYEIAYLTGGAHRELCPPDVLSGLLEHAATLDPRVASAVIAAAIEHTAEDVLEKVAVPTLLIAGDKDGLTPLATAEHMHRQIRGSRLVVFHGHSHLVQIERPADVHAAIDGFLHDAAI